MDVFKIMLMTLVQLNDHFGFSGILPSCSVKYDDYKSVTGALFLLLSNLFSYTFQFPFFTQIFDDWYL